MSVKATVLRRAVFSSHLRLVSQHEPRRRWGSVAREDESMLVPPAYPVKLLLLLREVVSRQIVSRRGDAARGQEDKLRRKKRTQNRRLEQVWNRCLTTETSALLFHFLVEDAILHPTHAAAVPCYLECTARMRRTVRLCPVRATCMKVVFCFKCPGSSAVSPGSSRPLHL